MLSYTLQSCRRHIYASTGLHRASCSVVMCSVWAALVSPTATSAAEGDDEGQALERIVPLRTYQKSTLQTVQDSCSQMRDRAN